MKALSGGLVEPTFEDSGDEVRVRGPGELFSDVIPRLAAERP